LKIQRKINSTTIVEATGNTVAEVFEALSRLESVFNAFDKCGMCGKASFQYQCQEDKQGHKYHKCICLSCGAEFRFGVKKSPPGVLFPQLKDQQGNWKQNEGWGKYERQQGGDDGGF
jgi:hypothetical protein